MKKFLSIIIISFLISILAFVGVFSIGLKDYVADSETTQTSVAKVTKIEAKKTKYEFYVDNKKYKGSFKEKDTFLADVNDDIIILYNKEKPEQNCVKELYLYDKVIYYLAFVLKFIMFSIFMFFVLLIYHFNKNKIKNETVIKQEELVNKKIFSVSNKFCFILYLSLFFIVTIIGIVGVCLEGLNSVNGFCFIFAMACVPFFVGYYLMEKNKKE